MMGKKLLFTLTILLISFVTVGAFTEDKTARPAATKIGFDESHLPQPLFDLANDYSKLKTKIESQFNATVTSHNDIWSTASLSGYDVFIIPTRFQISPTTAETTALRNWVNKGGCLIVMWYSECAGNCISNPDPTTDWPGKPFHDSIMEPFGIQVRAAFADSSTFGTVFGKYKTTPFTVGQVSVSGNLARMHTVFKGAKFLAADGGGGYIASYNDSAGKGKIFVIGALTIFQNANIDTTGNTNFLYNILTDCLGGGGGSTGKQIIVKVLGKPRTLAPGNKVKCIAVIRNKATSASDPTQMEFYLSQDKNIDGSDFKIGATSVPAIAVNKKKKIKPKFNVPNISAGNYYLIGKLLSNGAVKADKKTVEIR